MGHPVLLLMFLLILLPIQVVVVRGGLQMVAMSFLLGWQGLLPWTSGKKLAFLLTLVAVTGGLRIVAIFTSFHRLPLGDSTTILFSSPILVMVLSVPLLKVRIMPLLLYPTFPVSPAALNDPAVPTAPATTSPAASVLYPSNVTLL